MHVLLMTSFFPTSAHPQRALFHLEQASALAAAGHRVGVLVLPQIRPHPPGQRIRVFARSGLRLGVRVERCSGCLLYRSSAQLPYEWSGLARHLSHAWGLRAFKKYRACQGQPDICHGLFSLYGGELAARVKQQYVTPALLTEGFSGFFSGRIGPRHADAVRTALLGVDRVLAVGPALRQALQRQAPGLAIELLGYSVDPEAFTIPNPLPPPTPFTFAIIGHLIRRKGHDILLRAFATSFKGQEVSLLIGGDGEERQALEALAQNLRISQQVSFLGALSRAGVRETIQRSHCVVSASLAETFGITLIEAMACGRPVIATRSGGPESFVEPWAGKLVPTEDPTALADALRALREAFGSYDPQLIRQRSVERFSDTALTRNLEQIYREVIA